MEVVVTRQFAKDVDKELNKQYQLKLVGIIEHLQTASALQNIPNVKKLKGHKKAYRIKMDDYRMGLLFQEHQDILSRIMHGKEIYRYFP